MALFILHPSHTRSPHFLPLGSIVIIIIKKKKAEVQFMSFRIGSWQRESMRKYILSLISRHINIKCHNPKGILAESVC